MASSRKFLPLILALAVFAGAGSIVLVAYVDAAAAASRLNVVTKPGGVATGKDVKVVVTGAGRHFEALVGATTITKRFHREAGGKRVAVLHRGSGLRVGLNRIAVADGRVSGRRWTAEDVVVGAHRKGSLRVERRRAGRTAVILGLRGPAKHGFQHLRITINGKRLRGHSWVIGERTPANQWPLHRRTFRAGFGASDGLRYGANRVTILAWNDRGDYDRVVRQVDIARGAPLVDAGESKRVQVGRGVRLDGTATRAAQGSGVRYRWRIVSRPRHSKARLRGAHGARPRLVADRPGRYRVRLVALPAGSAAATSAQPRASASATASASTSTAPTATSAATGPAPASDETVVEATPKAPPIGVPVQTLTTSGDIQVGAATYQASGSWAQLVVLDRGTLALERNVTFGSGSTVTPANVSELASAIAELNPRQLAILSGGGRAVSTPELSEPSFLGNFAGAIERLGGNPRTLSEWGSSFGRSLDEGRWSIIGVPGVNGSAYANLFGGIFGTQPGEGSPAGAITGYLQEITPGAFGFAEGNFAPIDTQVPGAPPGVDEIRVGAHVYSSQPLSSPSTQGGFHVLVLNSLLESTAERTFTVSSNNRSVTSEVVAMQEFLSSISDPGEDSPGYLVIVQSIGNPEGSIEPWVEDGPLVENAYGLNNNATVPRNSEVWTSKSDGTSLAGAIGAIGGPVAHDQFAQMSTPDFEATDPPGSPGGFTMVASLGSYNEAFNAPADPAASPVSRLQATTPGSEARIVGTISRDRQSFWGVESAAWEEGLTAEPVTELAFQPGVAWPLSSTPEQKAANTYISERIGFDYEDVREAYWRDSGANWNSLLKRLERTRYPRRASEASFTEATFEALKAQLEEEFLMVGEVYECVENWTRVFSTSQASGAIDLQSVAAPIVQTVKSLDKPGSDANADTEGIIGESLWVASSLITFTGQEEISDSLGAVAAVFDFASALSSSSASSGPDAGLVEAEAEQLGVAVAHRFEEVQGHLELMGEILVSDWGKLQEASKRARKQWVFNREVRENLSRSIETSAKREFNAALLSTAYDVYVVSPSYINSSFKTPAEVYCYETNTESHQIHPLDSIETEPSSWISRPVGFVQDQSGGGERVLQRWFGLTVSEGEEETEHLQAVPGSITGNLFHPMTKTEREYLGQDPIAFFADPRFAQKWFYCMAVN